MIKTLLMMLYRLKMDFNSLMIDVIWLQQFQFV